MSTVRADHYASVLCDGPTALAVAAYADSAIIFANHRLDTEAFANLDARLDRRVYQQLVQYGPARAVRDRSPIAGGGAGKGEWSEVEGVRVNNRTSGGNHPVEQSPTLQRINARRMYQMSRDRVARKVARSARTLSIQSAAISHRLAKT
jgi:hypothetical protein